MVPAAEAQAAPAWLTPVDLSAPGARNNAPEVAVDAQGNAVAVWARRVGTNDVVQAAARPAGGDWSPPVDVALGTGPTVALDSAGNAMVAWANNFNGDNGIQASTRSPA